MKFEPNFTQIPNVFLDSIMQQLTEGELRVMLYIMRRTYGFQKQKDRISLSQFVDGIIDSEGNVLDTGCGLKRDSVIKNLKRLIENQIIFKYENGRGNFFEINKNWSEGYLKQTTPENQSSRFEIQKCIPNRPEGVFQTDPQKKGKESRKKVIVKEAFDFQKKLDKFKDSEHSKERLLYLYFDYKKIFMTEGEYHNQMWKLNSDAEAIDKIGWTKKEILAIFNYCQENFPTWKLNAVLNNGREILRKLTN